MDEKCVRDPRHDCFGLEAAARLEGRIKALEDWQQDSKKFHNSFYDWQREQIAREAKLDEQAATVIQYNGFVTITSSEEEYEEGFFRTVYTVEPDTEAWEAWKAEQPPEPNPTEPEQFATYNELASAIKSGVNNIL